MITSARWLTFGLVVVFGSIWAHAEEPPEPAPPKPKEESVRDQYKRLSQEAQRERDSTARVSARPLAAGAADHAAEAVNKHFSSLWQSRKVIPAIADDATFLRRVTLALNGVPATAKQAVAFLADDSPQKRTAKVEELLTDSRYADYWGFRLRSWIFDLRQVEGPGTDRKTMYHYARQAMAENRNWQQIAADLLQTQGTTGNGGNANFGVYFDGKPNEFADAAVRLFLGTNLACAQCHDDPYVSEWKQKSYWGLAAYFARTKVWDFNGPGNAENYQERFPFLGRSEASISTLPGGDAAVDGKDGENRAVADVEKGEVEIPGLKTPVRIPPTPLGGTPVTDVDSKPHSRREQFVLWLVAEEDFARAAVNRLWLELTGRGFVETAAGFSPEVDPVHEPLLDELAGGFVQHGYDLKWLMRTIVLSDVFQVAGGDSDDADELWHQWKLRPLNSDQWHDSVVRVTGEEERLRQMGTELIPLLAEERRTRQEKRKTLLAAAVVHLNKGRFAHLADQLPKPGGAGEEGLHEITEEQRKRLSDLRNRYRDRGRKLKETRTEARRSMSPTSESLMRMNGKLVSHCLQQGLEAKRIASVADLRERLDAVYLTVLGRRASEDERARFADVLPELSAKDLVWTLMQTTEFQTF